MRYIPNDFVAVDTPVISRPQLGYESVFKATQERAWHIGDIRCPSDGSGVLTLDEITDAVNIMDAPGFDLVIRATDCKADLAPVVTLFCDFADASSGNVAATLQPPEFSQDQSFNFAEGASWDLIGDGANSTKKVTALAGTMLITNAKRNSTFEVWALPQTLQNWKAAKNLKTISREGGTSPAVPIPDGKKGSDAVASGRSEPASLTITMDHRSMWDASFRYTGSPFCAMEEVRRGRLVVSEVLIFANCVLDATKGGAEGNDRNESRHTGFCEQFFQFAARLE